MTERLILRGEDGPEGHDFQEYQKHLREDGDFTLYTSHALTGKICGATIFTDPFALSSPRRMTAG
jgi:hypothetical protein